jgi:hypothetical protein
LEYEQFLSGWHISFQKRIHKIYYLHLSNNELRDKNV